MDTYSVSDAGQPRPFMSSRAMALAVIGLVGGAAIALAYAAMFREPGGAVPEPVVVARVAQSEHAVWEDLAVQPRVGDSILNVPMKLKRGSVTLELANGAAIRVHGPSDFTVVHEMLLDLPRGNATVTIPEQAVGFTIEMPGATVVDLGTQVNNFWFKGGGGQIQVLDGAVEVHSRLAGGQTVIVNAGEAISISETGIEPMAFNAAVFEQ